MIASQSNKLVARMGRTAATLAATLLFCVPAFAQFDRGPLAEDSPPRGGINICNTGQPVEVEATAGTVGPSPYTTLKLAFDAINAGTHQGVIVVEVCANTTEGTTPATLNSSGAGTAVYSSIAIRPLVDGLSISGNPATGLGVIQLKGADNVTIDGDNPNTAGTNRNLTINNTNTTTAIAGSVIRIATAATVVTSADNNTIRNLVLNGNVTGGNAATITLSTSSSNSSFVIYAGGNGGASATDAPTALTSVTTNTAPSGTTINNLVISNNAMNQAARAVVFAGAATSVSSGVTVSNNIIGASGALAGAPPYAAPATTVYTRGVYVSGANAVTITGNTIQNILSFVGTTMNAIDLPSLIGNGGLTISGNTVNGVVNNGTVSAANGILVAASTSNPTVSGNTISNVQTLAGATVNGLSLNQTGTGGLVEMNRVSTIYSRGAGGLAAYGINVAGGSAWTLQNNFVWDVNSFFNNGTLSPSFGPFGIRVAAGSNHRVYNNTVNLFGAAVGGSALASSAAFVLTTTTITGVEVRNNIFINTLTGAFAGSSVAAVMLPSGATSALNLTWNNNDYFAPATIIAQVGTTAVSSYTAASFDPATTAGANNLRNYTSTLLAANTNNDNASTVADPQLVSATDLHIAVGSPAQNAGATIATVTNDIDQQLRPGGGAYDIGADEVDGVTPPANDLRATAFIDPLNGGVKAANVAFSPQASFTNLGTTTQTNVTVRYRIVNASAVEVYNQTTTIPSITFNQTLTATFAPATIASPGTYTIFASSELVGDSNPANNQIAGTLTIAAPLAGTYTVGTGGNYTSLTATGGLFQTLNTVGATGNLTINIISDLSVETGANALNELAAGITVRIQPSGAARIVSGTSSTALVQINGADGVTIDGSLTGGTAGNVVGGDATLRNLTFINNSATAGSSVVIVSSGATGAQNVTLRNFNAIGQDPTITLIGIAVGGATAGAAGADNDNARIENCSVQRAILGIYSTGASTANPNTGNFVTKNDISATGVNRVRRGGMLIFNQDGIEVSLNQIGGMDSSEGIDTYGIGLGIQDVNATAVTNGGITNAMVTRNRINGVASVSAVGFSSFGIGIAGGTTGPNTISNNMISGVIAPSTAPDITAGIFVAGVTASSTRVYYNSVSLTGDRGVVASQIGSYAFAMSGTDPTVELKDNIFSNSQISGGGATARTYAIGTAATTFVNLDANFNVYFASGANAGFFRSGGLGATATDYAILAAWQAAITDDANSLFADPLFVSATDLHLQTAPLSPAVDVGTPIASVTVDIDGQARPATLTDIGADEIILNAAPTIAAVGVTRTAGDPGAVSTIANVNDAEDAENTLTVTVNGGATATVNGVTVSGISTTPAGVVSANVVASCSATTANFTLRVTDSGALFNESMLTVTVNPNLPPVLTYAANTAAVFGQSLMVNPATGPTDSSGITSIVVSSLGTFTGGATVNLAGVVSLTNSAPVGSHTLMVTATDSCATPTTANLVVTVAKADTLTTITSDTPDPNVTGTSVTVAWTVVPVAPGAGTPTGTVTVTVSGGAETCNAAVGVGQCMVTLTTLGNRTLTATYSGDSQFNGSSDTEAHDVISPANQPPTITAVGVTRTAGDAGAVSTIANVNDFEDAENTLVVTVNGGATATANGVTVSSISTTAAGVTSANVVAACGATSAAFTLRVTDSGALFAGATLNVTVNPNVAPTLTYPGATAAVFGQSLNVNPATGPTDSGGIASIVVQGAGTYTGGATVNPAGVVALTSAAPVGSHTLVIRATDNCALTTDANLVLNVGKSNTTTTILTDTPDPSVAGTQVTVTFSVVALAPGAGTPTGNVTVADGTDSCTATVLQGTCMLTMNNVGNRTLTATYAGDTNFNTSNGTAAHLVNGPSTDLSITKVSNTTMFGSGLIQYTVTASNLGPLPVVGATVQDTLPAGLVNPTWTCSGTNGGTCAAFGGGNINQPVNLPVNATVTFVITSSLAPNLPDSLVNTATVTSSAAVPDSDTANNSATVTDRVVLFRDGFEGPGPVPFVVLSPTNAGETRTQSLPAGDIAGMALGSNPVYVIEFRIGNSLAVISTRLFGDQVQVSLLQRNASGIWSSGPWLSLQDGQRLSFLWSNVDTAQQQGELRASLGID